LGDDLSSLERYELAEIVFQFAQRVAEAANGLAAHRSGCDAPFQKGFVRARNRFVVIVVGSGLDAGESPPVDGRNFVDLRAAAAPFAIEYPGVVVAKPEFIENRLHNYPRRCRQNLRISSTASSITSALISSAGRKRIEFSPERSVKTPRSKKPCQNCSRVLASGKSKARNRPRPRAAEISGSSRCNSRSRSRKYATTFAAFSTRCSSSIMRR